MAKRKTSEKKTAPQTGAEKSKPPQESTPAAKPDQPSVGAAQRTPAERPPAERPPARPAQKSTAPQEKPPRKADRSGISAQERHHLISQTAYYIAERRGFTPGDELEDWLKAEAEVDRMLERAPS